MKKHDRYQKVLKETRRKSRRRIRRNKGYSSQLSRSRISSSSIIERYIPGMLLFTTSLAASLSFTIFMDPSTVTAFGGLLPPSHRHRSILTVPSQIYQQPPPNSSPSFCEEEQDDDDDDRRSSTMTQVSSSSSSIEQQELKNFKEEAARLRREAEALQVAVQQSKLEKKRAEQEKVDGWIEDLFIEARFGCEIVDDDSEDDGNDNARGRDDNVSTKSKTSSSNASPSSSAISRSSSSTQSETELLKDVDQVLERLRDDRYSAEQINKIFRRLCEIRPQESRSIISPMMELLVDAACKLDCQERDENPNKRWNHRVERLLRKKLFARDWNIELRDEDEIDAENPWKM